MTSKHTLVGDQTEFVIVRSLPSFAEGAGLINQVEQSVLADLSY
jgi:hypothetical protein